MSTTNNEIMNNTHTHRDRVIPRVVSFYSKRRIRNARVQEKQETREVPACNSLGDTDIDTTRPVLGIIKS